MEAAVYHKYGSVDVVKTGSVSPPEPGPGDVLVRVLVSQITAGDIRIRSSDFPGIFWLPARIVFGLFKPKNPVLGVDFCGVVERSGEGVTGFKPGDRVFGSTGVGMGCHAQKLIISGEAGIARLPEGVREEDAGGVCFGGLTALYFLRDLGKVKPGDRVLVLGASGSVGLMSVQVAKYFGADTCGLCREPKLGFVRQLKGIRFFSEFEGLKTQGPFDLVMDTTGHYSLSDVKGIIKKRGAFLPVNTGAREIFQQIYSGLFFSVRVLSGVAPEKQSDIRLLGKLLKEGHIKVFVDQVFKLKDIKKAYLRAESGQKQGQVLVLMSDEGEQVASS